MTLCVCPLWCELVDSFTVSSRYFSVDEIVFSCLCTWLPCAIVRLGLVVACAVALGLVPVRPPLWGVVVGGRASRIGGNYCGLGVLLLLRLGGGVGLVCCGCGASASSSADVFPSVSLRLVSCWVPWLCEEVWWAAAGLVGE